MKDKKKLFIIIGIVVLLLALIITCVLLKKKPSKVEEITITFNVDGGTAVDNMKIKKGTEIELPKTVKDGYNFMGWYIDEEKLEDKITLNEDKTITAKWEQIPEDAQTFTITFNSNGGTSIDKLTVECDKELTLPANPKKEGYTFISWVDQHETPILDKALLTCEDVTLYANWEKVEEKKEEKKYTCPDGYSLDGTKCTKTKNSSSTCPSGTKEDGDKCIKISDYTQGERTCPTITIEGHDYQGTKVEAGTTFCYYAPVTSYTTQETCEAISNGLSIDKDGHYDWRGNKCYKAALTNYKTTCSGGYEYYTSDDILNKFGGHNNGGCYRNVGKTKYCEEGYALTGDKCVKTIDATLN